MKEYLSRLEIIREGGTSAARLPDPLGKKDTWLRLHELEGRWYVTASPEAGDLTNALVAATLEQATQLVKQAGEALEKSTSLEQFRQRLKELKAKHDIAPARGLPKEPKSGAAVEAEGGKGKGLPEGHFRAELTNRLDPLIAEALLQELVIETPEPAEVQLMLEGPGGGSGTIEKTKKRPGDTMARAQMFILVDYLKGDKDRFQGNYLKFTFIWEKGDERSATYEYREAPAGGWDRNLRLPLRRGVYPYTDKDSADKELLEVLGVGKYRLLLRVSKLKPKG